MPAKAPWWQGVQCGHCSRPTSSASPSSSAGAGVSYSYSLWSSYSFLCYSSSCLIQYKLRSSKLPKSQRNSVMLTLVLFDWLCSPNLEVYYDMNYHDSPSSVVSWRWWLCYLMWLQMRVELPNSSRRQPLASQTSPLLSCLFTSLRHRVTSHQSLPWKTSRTPHTTPA